MVVGLSVLASLLEGYLSRVYSASALRQLGYGEWTYHAMSEVFT